MELSELDALMEPREILIISVHDYTARIQEQLGEHLEDPPEGIYVKGQLLPVLLPNKAYYSEESYRTQTPLQNLDDTNSSVLDENAQVVIPDFIMKNKKRFLSSKPTLPVQEAMIVKTFIESYLESVCPHKENGRYRMSMFRYFKESGSVYVTDGTLDRVLEHLRVKVSDFIGDDVWSIYFVKLHNTEIIVEKAADYRIYEYTRRISTGEWQIND